MQEGVTVSAHQNLSPLEQDSLWDLDHSHPSGLDWGQEVDWYERVFHWRGWIPKDGLGGSIIPDPKDCGLRTKVGESWMASRAILGSEFVHAAECLNCLLSTLRQLLAADLMLRRIPTPTPINMVVFNYDFHQGLSLDWTICNVCYIGFCHHLVHLESHYQEFGF